jgi:hypothetical protein
MNDEVNQSITNLSNDQMAQNIILDLNKRLQDRSNSLQWQIDASISLLDYLKYISGYRVELSGNTQKIFKIENPPMNATGVIAMAEILSPVVNKDVVLGNLETKEICRMLQEYAFSIAINIYTHYDVYEIDKHKIIQIKNQALALIENTLKRAHEAKTLNATQTILKMSESSAKQQNEKTSSFDNILPFRSNG